jgi:hypothetical protein
MAVWIGLRMLWHGLVCDPNTMRPPQVSAVLRLLPSERFFSVSNKRHTSMKAPNHLIHQWDIHAIRLKPSGSFFSVFILGIKPLSYGMEADFLPLVQSSNPCYFLNMSERTVNPYSKPCVNSKSLSLSLSLSLY